MTYTEWAMDLDGVSVALRSGEGSPPTLATKGRCMRFLKTAFGPAQSRPRRPWPPRAGA